MMLQNRFTGLYLLFDLSVGARDLNTGIQLRLPPSLFRCSKANLDRCSSRGGEYGIRVYRIVTRPYPLLFCPWRIEVRKFIAIALSILLGVPVFTQAQN